MKVILDTNILIPIEDPRVLPPNLQELLRIIREHGHGLLIHPASLEDISRDPDPVRREVIASKLRGYPFLESPPEPTDDFLLSIDSHVAGDEIDDGILYALYRNAADFLITEDRGLHKKAARGSLENRTMTVDSALGFFRRLHARQMPEHPILKEGFVRNLNVEDPFFDSLREDYPEFNDWFRKISVEGRRCWVYHDETERVRALLVIKEENEPILTVPPIPPSRRLKLCTLKVDMPGFRMGELLLKIAFQYCIDNQILESYLTHFRRGEDVLVNLLEDYGFETAGTLDSGEEVCMKKLTPGERYIPPIDLARKYYPSFRDTPNVRKYVVPIRPEYHERLFPDYRQRQIRITEYSEINVQGNTIRKAYLSHSRIRRIGSGDILLFYRSSDQRRVTSLGVVESTLRTNDVNSIVEFVGNRTVYSFEEIEEMTEKQVLVILFRHHLNFPRPIELNYLRQRGILSAAPQSITSISHRSYEALKEGGGLDERFTVS